jgi:hypothetical protein
MQGDNYMRVYLDPPMPEIRTVTTLTTKREQLERAIASYEKALEQARADLVHVMATIAMFERDDPNAVPRLPDIHKLFKRGEIMRLCMKALESGPLDTRELSRFVLESKGFDITDEVLVQAIRFKMNQTLRFQRLRGKITNPGKRGAVVIWELAEPKLVPR